MFSAAKIAAPSAGGYTLSKSLRFRSSASAYLNRTPSVASNLTTWTWSLWIKRGTIGLSSSIYFSGVSSNTSNYAFIGFENGQLRYFDRISAGTQINLQTTQIFADPSAWYHIVIATDTTQATASNRVKFYVNGVQVTAFSSSTYPSQNYATWYNNTYLTQLGRGENAPGTPFYFDGYMAEINFIDGQQLTPSSFGSFNSVTGVWQPAKYTGTYGTNGFYLPFTNTTSTTTLGYDSSGNGNNWTTNNISLTAGSTYDSMTDVPTLTSATVANYSVMNPLDKGSSITLLDGNLQHLGNNSSAGCVRGTFVIPSTGKWYWEVTKISSTQFGAGISTNTSSLNNYVGGDAYGWGYYSGDGLVYNNGTTIRSGATLAVGDILGVAFDSGAGSLSFYKNNVLQATAITGFTPATINYFASLGTNSSGNGNAAINFGQQPFTYTPPTGYVALNAYNLPTGTILAGNKYMDATLWTGDGTSPRAITNAAGFQPDLVWVKQRSGTAWNVWMDSIRGGGQIQSNNTDAELSQASNVGGYVSSYNSNGFTATKGSDAGFSTYNGSGQTYVAWQWQAGKGTTSSNTNGSITSTVSVNASAGFSIITYTGNGVSGATVGHGLGVAPTFWIIKRRDGTGAWKALSTVTGSVLMGELNTTTTWASPGSPMTTAPTSSVITLDSSGDRNGSGQTYVIYAWTPIPGYSAITYFTGNGSTSGPFVYLGFRPKWTISKDIDGGSSWGMFDSVRNTYNVENLRLDADASSAEYTDAVYNYLSNGLQLVSADLNQNNHRHILISFAENPFRYALAR